ncbi:MAG TPA: type II secretion system F family protein [Noviherbaspirillum sp.]|uniref:type II secretion system F family protein n=1 Tax=Noviherbaspirillum sp. TaxID=1926288 RepID=UPI002D365FF6|nr:type II secretion system F family protein [Noviherbaspirillum sp.]HYD97604.1 type II secretion system F family protein [Noviherbaspirillum sp.]
MPDILGGNSFLIVSVLVFVAVTLLVESLYLMWKSYRRPEAGTIERRLQALGASHDNSRQTWLIKQRMLSDVPVLERWLLRVPSVHVLQKTVYQAGMNWTVSRLLLTCAALGGAVCMIVTSVAHRPFLVGLAAGAAASVLPLLYVQRKRRLRLVQIEQQLPEALDLIIRALRAGHAFSSSLQMAGEELPEPIASEFRTTHDEINFGVALQQALTNLSERVPVADLRYFVVSVLIQRESGGNLTEVLGNLRRLIRERLKLVAKVRVLSAEGRLSAWILGIMPFAMAGLLNLVNPAFMSRLWTDPIGIAIIEYMLTLMAVGVLILRKIIKIRV